MNSLLVGALLCALAADPTQDKPTPQNDSAQRGSAPTPAETNRAADTSQRGSRGSTAGGEERTGPPAAGVESGNANGMAGGRTDEGPRGGTGIREGGSRIQSERARGKANSQARPKNRKRSLVRPADSPPQRNEDPKPMGSGAPMPPVAKEPRPQGPNYPDGAQHGAAGGVASGTDEASG